MLQKFLITIFILSTCNNSAKKKNFVEYCNNSLIIIDKTTKQSELCINNLSGKTISINEFDLLHNFSIKDYKGNNIYPLKKSQLNVSDSKKITLKPKENNISLTFDILDNYELNINTIYNMYLVVKIKNELVILDKLPFKMK